MGNSQKKEFSNIVGEFNDKFNKKLLLSPEKKMIELNLDKNSDRKKHRKLLQTGLHGSAFLVRDGELTYVEKIIKIRNKNDEDMIKRETEILEYIRPYCSKYLICTFGTHISVDKKHAIIRMEYIPDSKELFEYLTENYREITEEKKLIIMFNLLVGLYKLHSIGVVHRDIKAENILIVPKTLNIHYIDYDTACLISNTECMKKYGGTYAYCSPEKMKKNTTPEATLKADIWALGVVLYILWNMKEFTPTSNNMAIKKYITNLTDKDIYEKIRLTHKTPISLVYNKIMRKMLTINYTNRPTTKKIIKNLIAELKKY